MQKGLLKIPEKKESGEVLPDDLLKQFGIEGEEQAILEQYLGNGMQMIHGRETRDEVLGRLWQEDPEKSLADTISVVMDTLDASAAGAGHDIPDMVRFIAGMSLLGQVADVAEAAGIATFDDDARVLALSELLASQISKGIRSGKYNPEELKQAAQQAAGKMKLDPASGVEKIVGGGVNPGGAANGS